MEGGGDASNREIGFVEFCIHHRLACGVGSAEYVHTHPRISRGVAAPAVLRDDLLDAAARDVERASRDKPYRLQEALSYRFHFFLEIRSPSTFDYDMLSGVVVTAATVIKQFVPAWTAGDNHIIVLANASTVAHEDTRARFIFKDLVVDEERAVVMQTAVRFALFNHVRNRLRRVFSSKDEAREEPVMLPTWQERFPSTVYAPGQLLATVGSSVYHKCRGKRGSHSSCTLAFNGCDGSGHRLVDASPLSLAAIFTSKGAASEEADAYKEKLHASAAELVRATLLRVPLDVQLFEPFTVPSSAPTVARKRKADKIVFSNTFQTEEAHQKRTRHGRTQVTNPKVLLALLLAVREHHPNYGALNLSSAYVNWVEDKDSGIERPEYTVFVSGSGDTYCQNVSSYHVPELDEGGRPVYETMGRVFFGVNRFGIRQRCTCTQEPRANCRPCKDYTQKPRALDESLRKQLGFGMDLQTGHGDFYHQLVWQLLPALRKRRLGGGQKGGRGGRGGRGGGRGRANPLDSGL